MPGLELLQSVKTWNLEFNAKHVDEAWFQIAERRFAQFESGAVKPVSWKEIKLKLNREL
ncbi:addiction module protein [Nitrosomonas eutropha]|uniref:addiction module protein n=1 Tax=Nitrosomonas eutropha TaxID=916 RepID=UPI0009F2E7E4